jgi:DNA-binding response OmpR family regulator
MNTEVAQPAQTTILVAEDEALMLKMLTYRLQKEGYRVVTATDGKQALDCLRTTPPDLVITDLMMPYHNGLEIVEFAKKTLAPAIPVIVLSSAGQESSVVKAFDLGADDFAVKPFSPNELMSRVRKHLGK